jgi:hypothetical protein
VLPSLNLTAGCSRAKASPEERNKVTRSTDGMKVPQYSANSFDLRSPC